MQYSAMVREHGLLLLSNVVMIPTVIYIHIYKEKKEKCGTILLGRAGAVRSGGEECGGVTRTTTLARSGQTSDQTWHGFSGSLC